MPKTTMTKRFYSTKSAIENPQILSLYSEAIEKATKRVKDNGHDVYYVVEVVAVIRRAETPIVVEEVRS